MLVVIHLFIACPNINFKWQISVILSFCCDAAQANVSNTYFQVLSCELYSCRAVTGLGQRERI